MTGKCCKLSFVSLFVLFVCLFVPRLSFLSTQSAALGPDNVDFLMRECSVFSICPPLETRERSTTSETICTVCSRSLFFFI